MDMEKSFKDLPIICLHAPITKPRATVPNPTYRKAFANELGPLSAPKKSSSSDEPNDESCICDCIAKFNNAQSDNDSNGQDCPKKRYLCSFVRPSVSFSLASKNVRYEISEFPSDGRTD